MSGTNDICHIADQGHIHIVLVEPENSLNIGSVARAMLNLGFHNLHLVAPQGYDDNKARMTACWGTSVLDNAKHHDTLEEALSGVQDVVGFTSRHGKYRPAHVLLPDWTAELAASPERKSIALLFGSEKNGLQLEHIEHCRLLIRIPSTESNPAFNLAQSVVIALYELSRTQWASSLDSQDRESPTWGEFYQLDQKVERILRHVQFIRQGSPATIPGLIRNLFRRTQPDAREMRVLLGMFDKIDKRLRYDAGDLPLTGTGKSEHDDGEPRSEQIQANK